MWAQRNSDYRTNTNEGRKKRMNGTFLNIRNRRGLLDNYPHDFRDDMSMLVHTN